MKGMENNSNSKHDINSNNDNNNCIIFQLKLN